MTHDPDRGAERLRYLHDAMHVAYQIALATAPPDADADVPDPAPMRERFERRYADLWLAEMDPASFARMVDEAALLIMTLARWGQVEELRRRARTEHMRQAHIRKYGSEFGTVEVGGAER